MLTGALDACGAGPVELRLTSLRDAFTAGLVDDVRAALPARISVVDDPDRTAGRGYYRDLCFKVIARPGPDEVEVGDGGFTDWSARAHRRPQAPHPRRRPRRRPHRRPRRALTQSIRLS